MQTDNLFAASGLASPSGFQRWRPGLVARAQHNELFASTRDAAGAGAAIAFLRDAAASALVDETAEAEDRRAVLWVQDAGAIRQTGRPYRPGLPADLRRRLVHVSAATPEDALFALEEGLRCRDVAAVVGELSGNPRALDFTASRRLSLASERHGVPLWLVRLEAARDLSSARMRWDIAAAPSDLPQWNGEAPGHPAFRAELFRARAHPPGEWVLDTGTGLSVRSSASTRSHAPGEQARA